MRWPWQRAVNDVLAEAIYLRASVKQLTDTLSGSASGIASAIREIKPEAPAPPAPPPGADPLVCPVCDFPDLIPMEPMVRAYVAAGKPMVVHSGNRLGCPRCISTLWLTEKGLRVQKLVKLDPEDEPEKEERGDRDIDSDLREPIREKRRRRAQ